MDVVDEGRPREALVALADGLVRYGRVIRHVLGGERRIGHIKKVIGRRADGEAPLEREGADAFSGGAQLYQ